MPTPEKQPTAEPYNPAREIGDEHDFACIWESLRRHPEFRKDAEFWGETWHEQQRLIQEWNSMGESDRIGPPGAANNQRRVEQSRQLSTLYYGALSYPTCPAKSLTGDDPSDDERLTDQELEELRENRGWKRGRHVLKALEWMLPAKLYVPRKQPQRPLGTSSPPMEYQVELGASDLAEHNNFGPIDINQPWPETSPVFRRAFRRACLAPGADLTVEELDLRASAYKLLEISNSLSEGKQFRPPSSPQEIRKAKDRIQGIAVRFFTLAQYYKAFLVPDSGLQPVQKVKGMLREIETKIPTWDEADYMKKSFLGRENQWEARLVAEKLPLVNGHLDYYGAAKVIEAARRKGKAKNLTISRLGKEGQREIRVRCEAVDHWARCVYPIMDLKPYIPVRTRKTRDDVGEKSET